MHARIATFEIPMDMPREAGEQVIAAIRTRLEEADGPTGAQRVLILADREQGRAHNITFFDTEENMTAAESFFEQMTPVQPPGGGDPGTRLAVNRYEVMLDHEVT